MIAWDCRIVEEAGSTQDLVKIEAAIGGSEGLVIQALRQTAGRGRHGRSWSPAQGNLYFSILLRPEVETARLGQLGLIAGVALAKTIKEILQTSPPRKRGSMHNFFRKRFKFFYVWMPGQAGHDDIVRLKWPNDVLLNGKKCAGILVETEMKPGGAAAAHVVLGVGVNIAAAPEKAFACVNDFSRQDCQPQDLRDRFLEHFAALYDTWLNIGFTPIRAAWMGFAHEKNTPITVKTGLNGVSGLFYDMDEHGNMVLKDPGGALQIISAGDVFIGSNASRD